MVGLVQRNRSLFFAAFEQEIRQFSSSELNEVDRLLDDPELVAIVTERLATRYSNSSKTGRDGIAPDRALRACALKHLKGWSFRELEEELRDSLTCRNFTRFDNDRIPDHTTFSRTFSLFEDDVTRKLHTLVVQHAQREDIAPGNKLRVDTTVTESNIHFPTDSSLLADGNRVLTRIMGRLSELCEKGAVAVVDHCRSVGNRVQEIHRLAKGLNEAARERLVDSYGKLVGTVGAVTNRARKLLQELDMGVLPITGDPLKVAAVKAQLEHFVPLVKQVVTQTKARVFDGVTNSAGKIVSIFEPHTAIIKKGKPQKPTEFGRVVRIDEVENGIVSGYDVLDGNPSDTEQWSRAITDHHKTFAHPPREAAGDRGFYSAANEEFTYNQGVKRVALPARGQLSESRAELQGKRWFKRINHWRKGIEARISTLKHPFHMLRAWYKGDKGFKRYVGWCVIANNLTSMARVLVTRRKQMHDDSKKHPAKKTE